MKSFASFGSNGRQSAPSFLAENRNRLTSAATVLLASLLLAPANALQAKPAPASASPLARLPLFFEANAGQAPAIVQYLARSQSGTFLLNSTGAVISLPARLASQGPNAPVPVHTLTLEFLQANPHATLAGTGLLPGKVNYFHGQDPARWRTQLPTFEKVQATGLYPGIDLLYYGNQQQLEYDFVLAPGADPNRISFRITGADQLRLDEHGNLLMEVAGAQLRQHAPVLHQVINGVNQPVSGRYRLKDHQTLAFEIGHYDAHYPLIIDPVLSYASYFGGSANDSARAVALDAQGNIYIAGQSLSPQLPATTNSFQPHFGGDFTSIIGDAFVAKFNSTGSSLLYMTYLGGSGFDGALALAVDSSGNAYLTGTTDSKDFPLQSPLRSAITGTPSLNLGLLPLDAFVTKLNPTGSGLVYSTYLGGDDEDQGTDIAVDAAGNAYVTGYTKSSNFPLLRAAQSRLAGASDAFVSKLSPDGSSFIYSTYLGGSDLDQGGGIAVDAAGRAFVTGVTQSIDFPTTNAFQPWRAGGQDAFVTEFGPGGATFIVSSYLGGSADDLGSRIAVDAAGNAYVTGGESSTPASGFPFPITPGGLNPSGVFVSSDAALSWTPSSSGLQHPVILSLAIDPVSPANLYAGTARGLARSIDGGGTWSSAVSVPLATNGFPPQVALGAVPAIAVDPINPATLYAGTAAGLFKSTNQAASWTLTPDLFRAGLIRTIALNPVAPATLYAGTTTGVFKSTNAASSWTNASSGLGQLEVRKLAVSPLSPNTLFAATAAGVFRSTNAAGSWTAANAGLTDLSALTLAIDPTTPTTLYLGTSTGLFKSVNAGTNWSQLSLGPALTNVAVSAISVGTPTIFAGTSAGVFQSVNGGASWTAASHGLSVLQVRALAVSPANPSVLYVGTVVPNSTAATSAFVTKIDALTHNLAYSTAWGNSGTNQALAIAVDAANNAYVAGVTDSAFFPTRQTSGFLSATNHGAHDAFVTTLNPDASAFLYSVYLGGSGDDFAYGLAVDPAGNAYVVGQTSSTNFPTVAAFQPSLAGGSDAFLAKIMAGAPALLATMAGNNLQLKWQAFAPEYVLETAPAAAGPSAAWTVVCQTPVVSNGWRTVTLPTAASAGVFRLHRH